MGKNFNYGLLIIFAIVVLIGIYFFVGFGRPGEKKTIFEPKISEIPNDRWFAIGKQCASDNECLEFKKTFDNREPYVPYELKCMESICKVKPKFIRVK